ncbi:hypothetical protein Tco_0573489 [Tanacetum coccineum]
MKLIELMNLCTQLQSRVLALETTKSNQALEIESLKRRVKSLEKRRKSRTPGFKRLRKVGSASRVCWESRKKLIGERKLVLLLQYYAGEVLVLLVQKLMLLVETAERLQLLGKVSTVKWIKTRERIGEQEYLQR